MKGSKKTILIVDDDPLVAGLYKGKLESAGYNVEIATDGQMGISKIHEVLPDAVLLDLMLPAISGVDVLRQIRAEKAFKELPVVVFSNAFATVLVDDAMSAGATRVLNKAESSPLQVLVCVKELISPGTTPPAAGQGKPSKQAPGGAASLFARPPRPSSAAAAPAAVVQNPQPRGPAAPVRPAAAPPPPPTAASIAPAKTTASPSQPDLGAKSQSSAAVVDPKLRTEFFTDGPVRIGALRKQVGNLSKESTEEGRREVLQTLFRQISELTTSAGRVRLSTVSLICSTLGSFLTELELKPSNLNASTLRTIAQTVDFLAVLFDKKGGELAGEEKQPCALVVDDESISRRAVVFALAKAKVSCVDLSDPIVALEKAKATKFDLIYLDVDMPVINGFELCSRIRADMQNKTTPVVFITGLSDFESRAKSTLSGGNDLIAKPFMFVELAVKSLTYITKGRLAVSAASNRKS